MTPFKNVLREVVCSILVSYLAMEPIAGGLGALMVAGLYFGTWKMVSEDWYVGGYPIWQAAWVVFFMSWTFQFIGHGVFEGKRKNYWDRILMVRIGQQGCANQSKTFIASVSGGGGGSVNERGMIDYEMFKHKGKDST